MRYRIFIEKRTEYAYAARRLYRHLTEQYGMHTVKEVRILRCLIIDVAVPQEDIPISLLLDGATEDQVEEDVVRALSEQEDGAFCCVIPLFRRPAELLTERALSVMLSKEDSVNDDARHDDRLYFRQADVFFVKGITDDRERARLKQLLVNPASAAELPLFAAGTLPPLSQNSGDDWMPIRDFRNMDAEALTMLAIEENLCMSEDDLRFVQSYFRVEEKRDPVLFELRMIDTYWSDHCRHITFLTAIQDLCIEDAEIAQTFESYLETREAVYGTRPKNITLMDVATVAEKYLSRVGKLPRIAETGERNAFTVRATVHERRAQLRSGEWETTPVPWLLHFKNETHNYSTEKDPYFGAFSSFGATIADPLSARAEVFAAMRLSGVNSWLGPVTDEDSPEALAQKAMTQRLGTESAAGFAAFGVQSGIPTGYVHEYLHPDFAAKHMEVCFSAAAAPAEDYLSAMPIPGDVILLVGAKTGCDGLCGGLSASADDHDGNMRSRRGPRQAYTSQMGDPQAARALVRLMRRRDLMKLVKRAEDVSSGGLAVAAAELAEGVRIDLDRVPTSVSDRLRVSHLMGPYEIAFSETQARMLFVIPSIHQEAVAHIAAMEDLEVTLIGTVTAERRFRMRWFGRNLLSLSRDFLDATGAERRVSVHIPQTDTENMYRTIADSLIGEDLSERYLRVMMHPEVASQKQLSERFDTTAGGRTVMLPLGGKHMLTPTGYMAYRFPTVSMGMGDTHTSAVFCSGYLPRYAAQSPYHGAYLSVLQVICRFAAAGIGTSDTVLSLQEYFPRVGSDPMRIGLPMAAMLGAFRAQMDYEVAAIGGKDSMNGTSERGDVPPTVIAFATAVKEQEELVTPEFKKAGSRVYLLTPNYTDSHLPEVEDERGLLRYLQKLHARGAVLSCSPIGSGGIAATVALMCFGNQIGFNYETVPPVKVLFEDKPGAFLVETDEELRGVLLGYTKDTANIFIGGSSIPLSMLSAVWQKLGEKLYASDTAQDQASLITPAFPKAHHSVQQPHVSLPKPRVLLPVFPYITGEDVLSARFTQAGFEVIRMLFSCRTQQALCTSVREFASMLDEVQVLAFAGGSYPDYGSIPAAAADPAARFAQAVFGQPQLYDALCRFRAREETLTLGLGEGFRMLLASPMLASDVCHDGEHLTLAENPCGHMVSKPVRVRIMSVDSPWMRFCESGDLYTLPVASKAGRCLIPGELVLELGARGQIAGQYVDADNNPTMAPAWNPFGSDYAVEGIFSRDGRVMGRMTHPDRVDDSLCINVPGAKTLRIFDAAMEYYKVKG
ncbi:MAG: phosphoribosylformylglycinamidine synthase subunit PurQ [Clostridia bacterium]|nr:phosphoribosylformylglycinamidine synthase subunit PurQ [Clostridia bacterium]